METTFYEKEVNGEFTGIHALIEDGKLTIIEQELAYWRLWQDDHQGSLGQEIQCGNV